MTVDRGFTIMKSKLENGSEVTMTLQHSNENANAAFEEALIILDGPLQVQEPRGLWDVLTGWWRK